jgi:hypothetical protein
MSYEYASVQFSKHDKYAQRLCISIFQFFYLKKNFTRVQPSLPKQITKFKIE